MVKLIKTSLKKTIGEQLSKLDFSELDMILAEAADLINQRPVGVRNLTEYDISTVTVNDLLHGRASNRDVDLRYKPEVSLPERLALVQQVMKAWWKNFYINALPALIPYPKWSQKYRPVQEGDVVILH